MSRRALNKRWPKRENRPMRCNRRQFCQSIASAAALTASGSRAASAKAEKSIKTGGTLSPKFEKIVCGWTPQNPRHDHQLIFPLGRDRLMLVWSEYYANRPSLLTRKPTSAAGQAADDMPCRISGRISTDDCRSWSESFILQDNIWRKNVKQPNLLRLPSGEVLFFFVGWDSASQRNIFMKRSNDDCETWSDMVRISRPGWYCNNHGRILRLSSGRILLPAHSPTNKGAIGGPYEDHAPLHSFVYYSDDGFATWKESANTMTAPGRGAHEPSMVELKDGRVMCILRTTTGRLYRAYSKDGGAHWSEPEPTQFPAPDSEPLVVRVLTTGDLMLVWNNVESHSNWPRTPLSVAISKDDGQSWGRYNDIDARPDRDAAYPYVFFQGDEAVVTYYTRQTSWARDTEIMLRIFKIEQFYA
jgi:sialidase-1